MFSGGVCGLLCSCRTEIFIWRRAELKLIEKEKLNNWHHQSKLSIHFLRVINRTTFPQTEVDQQSNSHGELAVSIVYLLACIHFHRTSHQHPALSILYAMHCKQQKSVWRLNDASMPLRTNTFFFSIAPFYSVYIGKIGLIYFHHSASLLYIFSAFAAPMKTLYLYTCLRKIERCTKIAYRLRRTLK